MSNAQFDSAVTEFTTQLRGFIRARVPDDATADDLTQETLMKVFRSRASLRDSDRLEAWLYRIARRTLIDYYRRRRPTEELPAGLAAESPDELAAVRSTILGSIVRLLDDLPDLYRIPVRLAEIEGMPLAEIAPQLGISLTAVKSRVRRGREMLKRMLQDCCRLEFDRHGTVIGCETRKPECCT
jgi:RNA polymerase sigma-70 factor, ECF subfamily